MKRRLRQTIIFSLLGILGVLLISVVIWVNWKNNRFIEYYNPAGNFSMKYPVSWDYEENHREGAVVVFYSPLLNRLDRMKDNVNIVIRPLGNSPRSLRAYSDRAIRQMKAVFKQHVRIIYKEAASLGGLTAQKVEFEIKAVEGLLKYLSVWAMKKDMVYQFTYTALELDYEKHMPKVERMLKSFKFED